MLLMVLDSVLIISAAIGLPALLITLWHLIRRSATRSSGLVVRLSQMVLMALGGLFILGGIAGPILLSYTIPLQDREFLSVAPGFEQFEFTYTSSFRGMADFQVEYHADQVCLHFVASPDSEGYGGWMIILWAEFLAKIFKEFGYPQQGRDLSGYQQLSFQLKADREDAVIQVSIKDTQGREPRILLPRRERGERITTDFSTFILDLKDFQAPGKAPDLDLKSIETISFAVNVSQIIGAREELPAEGEPVLQTVCIKDIRLK